MTGSDWNPRPDQIGIPDRITPECALLPLFPAAASCAAPNTSNTVAVLLQTYTDDLKVASSQAARPPGFNRAKAFPAVGLGQVGHPSADIKHPPELSIAVLLNR